MGKRSAQVALALLLFFPFVYYPISTALWLEDPDWVSPYKNFIAGVAALLTAGSLALLVYTQRHELKAHFKVRSLLAAPETWGLLFLMWIIGVSLFQREPSTLQNLIVYTVFFLALLLCRFCGGSIKGAVRVFVWIFVPVLLVLGVAEAIADPMRSEVGWQMGGPRLYASYAIVGVIGLFAVPMSLLLRTILGFALLAGAVISSSRSSLVTLLVVLVVGLLVTAIHVPRRMAWALPAGALALFVTFQLPWIRDHMAISAITTPGFVIDDSGRGRVWIPTIESWSTQPIVGLGAGSSQTVAGNSDFALAHPHSEYLRILHDSGLIGFLFFSVFVILALGLLWPRVQGSPRSEPVIAGFLVIVAGLVLGTIENYLVFPSLMWPSAVFLGLGLAAARQKDGLALVARADSEGALS